MLQLKKDRAKDYLKLLLIGIVIYLGYIFYKWHFLNKPLEWILLIRPALFLGTCALLEMLCWRFTPLHIRPFNKRKLAQLLIAYAGGCVAFLFHMAVGHYILDKPFEWYLVFFRSMYIVIVFYMAKVIVFYMVKKIIRRKEEPDNKE